MQEPRQNDVHQSSNGQGLGALGAQYEHRDPREVLGRLPVRASAALESNGITTIAALREWLNVVDVRRISNFGAQTHATLCALLRRLDAEGSDSVVFGQQRPETLQALGEAYLAHLGPAPRTTFEMRFKEGATLDEIGAARGVTRERARQVLEKQIRIDAPSWSQRAEDLLAPGFGHIESRGGVALVDRFMAALEPAPKWAVDLALLLSGNHLYFDTDGSVVTTASRESFESLRRALRAQLEECLDIGTDVRNVREVLVDAGLQFPDEEFGDIVTQWLGFRVDGQHAYPLRRRALATYLNVLHAAGGPVSAQAVAFAAADADPQLGDSARNAVASFGRARQAFRYGRGLWIHEDHLPLPRAALDDLAAECLPGIESAGGQALSATLLLRDLQGQGKAPAELTAYMLRDAILQTGKARGWRSGTNVAWRAGDIRNPTIASWIAEVAAELELPFTSAELAVEVAMQTGFEAASVLVQVPECQELLPLGFDRHISTRAVFDSSESLEQARALVHSRLPIAGLASSAWLVARCPEFDGIVERFGASVLWGLARRDTARFRTRVRGCMLWRAEHGDDVWRVLRGADIGLASVFSPLTLATALAAHCGISERHVSYSLVSEGVECGSLCRVDRGSYTFNDDHNRPILAGQDEERSLGS